MARIPLEDNYVDVLNKAQRGLGITDEQLAHRAKISPADLASLKAGQFHEVATRRIAQHLRLHADALCELGKKAWYPDQPLFKTGFAAFNTPCEDMTVNNFIIWDERTRHAAVFDTGANADPVLELIASEQLLLRYIFLTHTHDDHVDSFYVLDGVVEFTSGDGTITKRAGEFVAAPPGTRHGFRSANGERARVLNLHTPDAGFANGVRGSTG